MRRAQRHNDFKNGVGGVTKRSCYRGPNDRTMHPTRAPARRRRNPYNTCHVATPMIIIDITIAATSQHWVRLLLSLVLALVLVLVFVFVVCTCIFTRTCTTRGVRVRPRSARLAPIPRRPRGQASAARQFFDPDGLAPHVNDSKPTAVHIRRNAASLPRMYIARPYIMYIDSMTTHDRRDPHGTHDINE